jgi:hypothetical protein
MNLHVVTEFNKACNCERNSPDQTIMLDENGKLIISQ